MTKLADASIKAFGPMPKAGFESSYVTVPAAFLEELIGAIQGLKDEVAQIREERDQDRQEIAALRASVASLEKDQDILRDNQLIQLQLIHKVKSKQPARAAPPQGEKSIARIAKIDEVLKSRGPTTLSQLERILGIDRATMTRLLAKLDMRRYELHARPGDAREKVLRLRAQIR
jgi:cell division septum initiation protein DivIVA